MEIDCGAWASALHNFRQGLSTHWLLIRTNYRHCKELQHIVKRICVYNSNSSTIQSLRPLLPLLPLGVMYSAGHGSNLNQTILGPERKFSRFFCPNIFFWVFCSDKNSKMFLVDDLFSICLIVRTLTEVLRCITYLIIPSVSDIHFFDRLFSHHSPWMPWLMLQ
jgi:hypothetical protein